jgi:hypothetical protein
MHKRFHITCIDRRFDDKMAVAGLGYLMGEGRNKLRTSNIPTE